MSSAYSSSTRPLGGSGRLGGAPPVVPEMDLKTQNVKRIVAAVTTRNASGQTAKLS